MFGSKKDKDSKKSRAQRNSAPSLISRDMNIMGNLISDGVVDIDGRIEGNVRAMKITIRKDGVVAGDLQADEIEVYGQVKGLVRAKDVHLYTSAKVEGSIMHEVLSMEEGAFVDGKFKRTDRVHLEDAMQPQIEMTQEDTAEDEVRLLENIRLISNQVD
ncbi:MAG: polymer-forming cytoskeletal protein [Rickettsiales bacterium]|nr:polymer-forming cytoskeletal protein [Rickettsiales bacterium]